MSVNLMSYLKKNRPSVSTALLRKLGVPGLVNSSDSDLGFETYLERLSFAAGVNTIIQVNDCEDDAGFSESDDNTFDLETFASVGKRVGTNCMKLTETLACDNSQYIQLLNINESAPIAKKWGKKQMSWEDTKYLGFWIHNAADTGAFGTAGELQVAIVSNGVVQTKVEIQAVVDVVHQWVQIDMVAQGWDLSSVEALRFYSNNANTGETVYIDDILRYQISYCSKPYYGCSLPIKSGSTITDGQLVRWTIDGAIPYTSSANVADLGNGYLYGNSTLVGTAKRDKWVMIPGMHLVLVRANASTTAGSGLETVDGVLVTDVSSGVDELGFVKGLEGAGNKYDDIFALMTFGGTEV